MSSWNPRNKSAFDTASRAFKYAGKSPINMWLWRFRDQAYSVADEYGDHLYSTYEVQLECWPVHHLTPTGARLVCGKFVSFQTNKRFACRSIGEALESYRQRKLRQERIYLARAKVAANYRRIACGEQEQPL